MAKIKKPKAPRYPKRPKSSASLDSWQKWENKCREVEKKYAAKYSEYLKKVRTKESDKKKKESIMKKNYSGTVKTRKAA